MKSNAPLIFIPWDCRIFEFLATRATSDSKRSHVLIIHEYMRNELLSLRDLSSYSINETVDGDNTLIKIKFFFDRELSRSRKKLSEVFEDKKQELIESLQEAKCPTQIWVIGNKPILQKLRTYFKKDEVEYLDPMKIDSPKMFEIIFGEGTRFELNEHNQTMFCRQ